MFLPLFCFRPPVSNVVPLDNPIMDSFTIDLPFTRESWHGRIKACRGVLASMDTKTFERFEEAHIKILQQLPEQFTIKHKVFLTYYIITK